MDIRIELLRNNMEAFSECAQPGRRTGLYLGMVTTMFCTLAGRLP